MWTVPEDGEPVKYYAVVELTVAGTEAEVRERVLRVADALFDLTTVADRS